MDEQTYGCVVAISICFLLWILFLASIVVAAIALHHLAGIDYSSAITFPYTFWIR